MSDKQQILEHTSPNKVVYPKQKIYTIFTLLGGGVGGLLVGLAIFISLTFERFMDSKSVLGIGYFFDLLTISLLSFIYGTIIGCIPALLCAWVICKQKLNLKMSYIYVRLFLSGALVIIIPAIVLGLGFFLVLMVLYLFDDSKVISFESMQEIVLELLSGAIPLIIPSILGGLSSVILGKWTLPKEI